MVLPLDRDLYSQWLGNRPGMERHVYLCYREARALGPIIYRGVVILNALRNGGAKPLPVIAGRDLLAFRGAAQEPAFDEHCRDLHVAQDMKTRVLHPAIEGGES